MPLCLCAVARQLRHAQGAESHLPPHHLHWCFVPKPRSKLAPQSAETGSRACVAFCAPRKGDPMSMRRLTSALLGRLPKRPTHPRDFLLLGIANEGDVQMSVAVEDRREWLSELLNKTHIRRII